VTNAATFTTDLGVFYLTTGLRLKKVASAPATGEYSVTAGGVYTFAAADTGLGVLISYTYTIAATGSKIPFANQLLGVAPTFMAVLTERYDNKSLTLQLNACVANKLTFNTKQDDYTIPEFDFGAFADASNNVGSMSMIE
jgi:hypothetical protein